MKPIPVIFVGGDHGEWRVERILAIRGASLDPCASVSRIEGTVEHAPGVWALRGVRTHERYTHLAEHDQLAVMQPDLGRQSSTCAVLIPLSKSEAWWQLSQDERREVLEARSHHIATGLRYLPAIARRLYHGREIGGAFDFLTWFEFAPADRAAFDELVAKLRGTEEWRYVDREVEVRLTRDR
jgi:chlorite dismutase